MSWNLKLVGRDKEKLKEAVRASQCKDEVNQPHNGTPKRVVDFICSEIDRIRIYQYGDQVHGIEVDGSGSWHESGFNEKIDIRMARMVE